MCAIRHVLFLIPLNIHQQCVQPVHALLKCARVVCQLPCLCWGISSWLAFYGDVEVDQFLGQRRHIIFEAEGVFADMVGSEDVVTLALAYAVEENLVVGILHLVVDIEGASSLDLYSIRRSVTGNSASQQDAYSEVELRSTFR